VDHEYEKINEKKYEEIHKRRNDSFVKVAEFGEAILNSVQFKNLELSDEIPQDLEAKKLLILYEKRLSFLKISFNPKLMEELSILQDKTLKNKWNQALMKLQQEFIELLRMSNYIISGIMGRDSFVNDSDDLVTISENPFSENDPHHHLFKSKTKSKDEELAWSILMSKEFREGNTQLKKNLILKCNQKINFVLKINHAALCSPPIRCFCGR